MPHKSFHLPISPNKQIIILTSSCTALTSLVGTPLSCWLISGLLKLNFGCRIVKKTLKKALMLRSPPQSSRHPSATMQLPVECSSAECKKVFMAWIEVDGWVVHHPPCCNALSSSAVQSSASAAALEHLHFHKLNLELDQLKILQNGVIQ